MSWSAIFPVPIQAAAHRAQSSGHVAHRQAAPGAVLEAIARKRGCLIKGGDIDMEKAERILLTEFRAGKLGTISLEQPDKNVNGQ